MRVLQYIIILSIGQFVMACNNKKDVSDQDQHEVQHVFIKSEEDVTEPAPPGFTTRFKNLQEWLVNICENEKPPKPIATFRFGLFQGQDEYILCLTGTNTYEVSADHTATRIEFSPKDMYFILPKAAYQNVEREKILERLTTQLKEFTESNTFKQSFLSGATSITTDWKGEIWSKAPMNARP